MKKYLNRIIILEQLNKICGEGKQSFDNYLIEMKKINENNEQMLEIYEIKCNQEQEYLDRQRSMCLNEYKKDMKELNEQWILYTREKLNIYQGQKKLQPTNISKIKNEWINRKEKLHKLLS